MKVAWLIALGPGSDGALERLEVVADTYLSMNAPAQCALPTWLAYRSNIQVQISERLQGNLTRLNEALQVRNAAMVNRLQVEGGWYAVLRIPALHDDVATCCALIGRGVLVHPGSFFGMPVSGWLVLSLLTEPMEFVAGVGTILDYLESNQ